MSWFEPSNKAILAELLLNAAALKHFLKWELEFKMFGIKRRCEIMKNLLRNNSDLFKFLFDDLKPELQDILIDVAWSAFRDYYKENIDWYERQASGGTLQDIFIEGDKEISNTSLKALEHSRETLEKWKAFLDHPSCFFSKKLRILFNKEIVKNTILKFNTERINLNEV